MGSSAYARAGETIMRICRGEADVRMLRLEALDAIRRAVSFDAYAWLLTDPETSVGSSPLADVPCLPQLPQLIRLKYATAVARQMFVSENTVQDHLKSIFDKSTARSRRALLARALGT